ncbi:LysR substrate-binding domain-containing protein [Oceanimonas sp. NS1]|nr:LysR substrate-binding domain-containing protein [Oceanimonas sp. NS1]
MSPGSVGLKLYPQLLALQRRHPRLVIDYRFAPNASVEQAVAGHSVDLGLMTRPSNHEAVQCRAMAEEALLLVTPAGMTTPDWSSLLAHLALSIIRTAPTMPACYSGPTIPNLNMWASSPNRFLQPDWAYSGAGQPGAGLYRAAGARGVGLCTTGVDQAHALPHPVSETIYAATHRHRPMPNRVGTVLALAGKQL